MVLFGLENKNPNFPNFLYSDMNTNQDKLLNQIKDAFPIRMNYVPLSVCELLRENRGGKALDFRKRKPTMQLCP